MNPQLLTALAVERMKDIAREAEERHRVVGVTAAGDAGRTRRAPSSDRRSLRASIGRLQPGG
jgi:hypothetical protein